MTAVGPFEQSPQARFQITEQPAALPGSCLLCRGGYDAANRPWFVDTGLQIEFWGAGYICAACLIEMANTVGFILPTVAAELRAENNKLRQDVFNLEVQVASLHELESSVDRFVHARAANRHPSRGRVLPFGQAGVLPESGSGGSGPQEGGTPSPGTTGELGAGTGTSDEPSDGQGMDDLRSDESGSDFVVDWPRRA